LKAADHTQRCLVYYWVTFMWLCCSCYLDLATEGLASDVHALCL